MATTITTKSSLDSAESLSIYEKLHHAAEEHGKPIYDFLLAEHQARITREREKSDFAYAARRRAIERIGLPQVRNYRLNLLEQEERTNKEQLNHKAHAYPEMVPLIVLRIEGDAHE